MLYKEEEEEDKEIMNLNHHINMCNQRMSQIDVKK